MIARKVEPAFEMPADLGRAVVQRLRGKKIVPSNRPIGIVRRQPKRVVTTVSKPAGTLPSGRRIVEPAQTTALVDLEKAVKAAPFLGGVALTEQDILREQVKRKHLAKQVQAAGQSLLQDMEPAIELSVDELWLELQSKTAKPTVQAVMELCIRCRMRNQNSLDDGDIEVEALARGLERNDHRHLATFARDHFGFGWRGKLESPEDMVDDVQWLEAFADNQLKFGK